MENLIQFFNKGGVVMIPLLLTSVVGLAVIIERFFFLRRGKIIRPELVNIIYQLNSVDDIRRSIASLKIQEGPFINIIHSTLRHADLSKEEMKELIDDQGRQESRHLERGLVIIETVASISPLLGLLGTVIGMIKVFQVISIEGLGQTQSLSAGISEALLTTVVGLSIAIPTLIAYNYFNQKVQDLVLEIEKHSSYLFHKIHQNSNSSGSSS